MSDSDKDPFASPFSEDEINDATSVDGDDDVSSPFASGPFTEEDMKAEQSADDAIPASDPLDAIPDAPPPPPPPPPADDAMDDYASPPPPSPVEDSVPDAPPPPPPSESTTASVAASMDPYSNEYNPSPSDDPGGFGSMDEAPTPPPPSPEPVADTPPSPPPPPSDGFGDDNYSFGNKDESSSTSSSDNWGSSSDVPSPSDNASGDYGNPFDSPFDDNEMATATGAGDAAATPPPPPPLSSDAPSASGDDFEQKADPFAGDVTHQLRQEMHISDDEINPEAFESGEGTGRSFKKYIVLAVVMIALILAAVIFLTGGSDSPEPQPTFSAPPAPTGDVMILKGDGAPTPDASSDPLGMPNDMMAPLMDEPNPAAPTAPTEAPAELPPMNSPQSAPVVMPTGESSDELRCRENFEAEYRAGGFNPDDYPDRRAAYVTKCVNVIKGN